MASADNGNFEHETFSLSGQAEAIAQLFDEAAVTLATYKETRKKAESDRFNEIIAKISSDWGRLRTAWTARKPDLASQQSPPGGMTLRQSDEIHESAALDALRTFKDEIDTGLTSRGRHVIMNPEHLAYEQRRSLRNFFKD